MRHGFSIEQMAGAGNKAASTFSSSFSRPRRVDARREENSSPSESHLKLAIVTDPHYLDNHDEETIRKIGKELEGEKNLDGVLYLGDYCCLQDKGGNLSVPEKARLTREFFNEMDTAKIDSKFFGVVMGNNDDPASVREIFSNKDETYSKKYSFMQGDRTKLGRYELAGFGGKMRGGSGGKIPPNTRSVFDYKDMERMLSGIESPQYSVLATHECSVIGTEGGDLMHKISKSKMTPPALHLYGHDHCKGIKLRLTDNDSHKKYSLENQGYGGSQNYGGVTVTRTHDGGRGDDYKVEYSKSSNPHTTVSLKTEIAMFGGYSVVELNDKGDYRKIEIKDRKVKA